MNSSTETIPLNRKESRNYEYLNCGWRNTRECNKMSSLLNYIYPCTKVELQVTTSIYGAATNFSGTHYFFLVFDLRLTMKRKFKLLPDIIKVYSADKWIKNEDNSLTNADNFSRDAGQVYKQVNKSILKTILQKLPTEFLAAQTSRFGNRWRWQRYFRQDVALRGKAWVKSARSSEWLSAGT